MFASSLWMQRTDGTLPAYMDWRFMFCSDKWSGNLADAMIMIHEHIIDDLKTVTKLGENKKFVVQTAVIEPYAGETPMRHERVYKADQYQLLSVIYLRIMEHFRERIMPFVIYSAETEPWSAGMFLRDCKLFSGLLKPANMQDYGRILLTKGAFVIRLEPFTNEHMLKKSRYHDYSPLYPFGAPFDKTKIMSTRAQLEEKLLAKEQGNSTLIPSPKKFKLGYIYTKNSNGVSKWEYEPFRVRESGSFCSFWEQNFRLHE